MRLTFGSGMPKLAIERSLVDPYRDEDPAVPCSR
jgi:hypothetical protein